MRLGALLSECFSPTPKLRTGVSRTKLVLPGEVHSDPALAAAWR